MSSTLIRCSRETHKKLKLQAANEDRSIQSILDELVQPTWRLSNDKKRRLL